MSKKVKKYFLLTDPYRLNPNPGDILVGKGIQHQIRQVENQLENIPVFNTVNMFDYDEYTWKRIEEEADTLVVCGTCQLNEDIPGHFDSFFYNRLKKLKTKGIPICNISAGFSLRDNEYNSKDIVDRLVNKHKNFITDNFSVYDFVSARDSITKEVLDQCNIPSVKLLDSSYYSSAFYGLQPNSKKYNLIFVRDIGEENNKKLIALSNFLKKKFSIQTYIIAYGIRDYRILKNNIQNLICCNDPESLVKLIGQANKVISLCPYLSMVALRSKSEVVCVSLNTQTNMVSSLVEETPLHRFIDYAIVDFKQIEEEGKKRLENNSLFFESFLSFLKKPLNKENMTLHLPEKIYFTLGGGLGDVFYDYLKGNRFWDKIIPLKKKYPNIKIKVLASTHNPQSVELFKYNPYIEEAVELGWVNDAKSLFERNKGDSVWVDKVSYLVEDLPSKKMPVYLSKKEKDFFKETRLEYSPYVMVHPFAGKPERIGMDISQYPSVIDMIIDELGLNVIVIGGTSQRLNLKKKWMIEENFEYERKGLLNLVNKTNSRIALNLTKKAKAFVGNWSAYSSAFWSQKKPTVIIQQKRQKKFLERKFEEGARWENRGPCRVIYTIDSTNYKEVRNIILSHLRQHT